MNREELEILNCIVRGWHDNGSKIPGGVCYNEVFHLLNKLGVSTSEYEQSLDATIKRYQTILDME